MAHTNGVTFGDLQMDTRYRKLERALKLACLKNQSIKESLDSEVWTSAGAPSISTINADGFDSSINVPLLQTSRYGSEVVSSSNNLRNTLLRKTKAYAECKKSATSSVKRDSYAKSDSNIDALIMPPPDSTIVHSKGKTSKTTVSNTAKNMSMVQSKLASFDMNGACTPNEPEYEFSKVDVDDGRQDVPTSLKIVSNDLHNGNVRVFSKWRVVLNEQGQLVIRGTLECGKIARSKPVIRRLTAIRVESVYKHLYHLRGNIVDERNELPDYVRGKFCNGFPDDWENVHQIWRSFVRQGCAVTFRWPTPITDSDDDLKSEITDITLSESKNNNDVSKLHSFVPRLSTFSERSPNVSPVEYSRNCNSQNIEVNETFTQTYISGTSGSLYFDGYSEAGINHNGYNKENCKQQENVNANHTFNTPKKANKLNDILQKDKLNIILNNLADKNCSWEYIKKIFEMFDCLNYVVSYRSVTDDESHLNRSRTGLSKHSLLKRRIEAESDREEFFSESIPIRENVDYTQKCYGSPRASVDDSGKVCGSNMSAKKRNFTEVERDNDGSSESSESSESETYAGIRKLPIERILRQREACAKPCKRKARKRMVQTKHRKHDNLVTVTGRKDLPKRCDKFNYNDSSVSIIGEESECSSTGKYDNAVLRSNCNFITEKTKVERWQELNASAAKKDRREMQAHFVQEEEEGMTLLSRTKKRNCDSADRIGDCRNGVNAITIDKDPPIGINSTRRNVNERNDNMNTRYWYCAHEESLNAVSSKGKSSTSTTSKPSVIASVPVDASLRVVSKESNVKESHAHKSAAGSRENENKNAERIAERSNDGTWTQTTVSSNKASSTTNDNLTLRANNRQDSRYDSKTQPSDTDFIATKQSTEDHAKSSQSDGCEMNCKAKSLTAWTPRVILNSESNELSLIFEGSLLNEAGHVTHRKFATNIVLRRVSAQLIETIDHQFYRLVGDINNTKYAVPKELLSQCRYGCPSKVQQFCKAWNLLQGVSGQKATESEEKLCSMPVDSLNVPVSSKGRRILPPLSYWTGERLSFKDNDLVYNPGIKEDSLLSPKDEIPPEAKKVRSTTKQREGINSKRKTGGQEVATSHDNTSSTKSTSLSDKSTPDVASSLKHSKDKEGTSLATKRERNSTRRRLATCDADREKDLSVKKGQRFRPNEQPSTDCVEITGNRNTQSVDSTSKVKEAVQGYLSGRGSYSGLGITKSKSMKAGDIELSVPSRSSSKFMITDQQSFGGRSNDIICTYYQDIPLKDDLLSDDQMSHV